MLWTTPKGATDMPTSMVEGAEEFVALSLNAFRENLTTIREKRGLTYLELAVRAGMTEKNAYQIVNGKQGANIRTIAQLARAVRVPVGDLFMDPAKFARRYEKAGPLPPLTVTSAPAGSRKSTSVTKDSPFCKPITAVLSSARVEADLEEAS